jgi:hypothetical protein
MEEEEDSYGIPFLIHTLPPCFWFGSTPPPPGILFLDHLSLSLSGPKKKKGRESGSRGKKRMGA